jgi:hypothetical protein
MTTSSEWILYDEDIWDDDLHQCIADLVSVEDERDEWKLLAKRAQLCETNANNIIYKLRADLSALRAKEEVLNLATYALRAIRYYIGQAELGNMKSEAAIGMIQSVMNDSPALEEWRKE